MTMAPVTRIAVASLSFARNAALRAELSARYPNATFSDASWVLEGAELIKLLRGHDAAIVGLERIDEAVLAEVPELRIISKYGVGFDGIDLDALKRRGVLISNFYNTEAPTLRIGAIGAITTDDIRRAVAAIGATLEEVLPKAA